jgi:FlaA1/EpsC-like NDP-sugar epimerase
MGEPIKIIDLVINMIKLAGLEVKNDKNPNGDVEIKYIGLRPGEKLYEELLLEDSNSPTEFKNIYISNEKFLKIENYENIFSLISKSIEEENIASLKELIKDVNIGYKTD